MRDLNSITKSGAIGGNLACSSDDLDALVQNSKARLKTVSCKQYVEKNRFKSAIELRERAFHFIHCVVMMFSVHVLNYYIVFFDEYITLV